MTTFNTKQLAGFKQKLQQQQNELLSLAETGKNASGTVQLDQTSVGRLSRMDALQGQAMAQERLRRRQLELQKIKAALQRIECGDYGYCVRCDEEIAPRRLEFDPATPLCIDCASQSESN